MNKLLLYFVVVFCCFHQGRAQEISVYKSWNPARESFPVLEGQGWPGKVKGFYDRLPAKAESVVRPDVWYLAGNSAGISLRFYSNANEIIVKYTVKGSLQMPHMPATGVSGVDLYAKDRDGKWLWSSGRYTFGDTVTYRFEQLEPAGGREREYTLFLPLYNSVKWMEVYVPEDKSFRPKPLRQEKPIVVYGTSIAQGACATRPGLAWTAILQRKLDQPVINLGFSGNGRLEKEVLEMIAEIDAAVYVLDCLPNLTGVPKGKLMEKIAAAVLLLQRKRPGVPVLLTAHDGYTDEEINPGKKAEYELPNMALNEIFSQLKERGVKNIHLLSKRDIGQDIESMVDGVHPNDIGMMNYANAYEKRIREILNRPVGHSVTTKPVTQYRELPGYDWEKRHNEVIAYNSAHTPELVLAGNSITHFWSGMPTADIVRGAHAWEQYFSRRNVVNMGFGWDRIENLLWRVYHGELDGFAAKQVVLLIGTNNLQENSDAEIGEGVQLLLSAIKARQPAAKILLLGVLPRRGMEDRIAGLNRIYARLALDAKVQYADACSLFVDGDNKLRESLFSDGLHPNSEGYVKLGEFISKRIDME